MKKLLCVCIPTFNRANRLRKALSDLHREIMTSKNKDSISIYLSDNGSLDDTTSIAEKYREIFKAENIPMSYDSWAENRGFDENIMRCYKKCDAEYLWFLSDDDNIIHGALDLIVDDITAIGSNVLFYNFRQRPFGFDNPLVKEKVLYYTFETHEPLSKIVRFPKLSSIVIKKGNGKSGSKVSRLNGFENSGFTHVALALQTIFDEGRLLLSNTFIAYPDADFMDHIDFSPGIFNSLNGILHSLCEVNKKMQLYPSLCRRHVSPLNSSLLRLSSFYFGRMMLTPAWKNKLVATVKHELKQTSFVKNQQIGFIRAIIRFLVAYTYYRGRQILTGRSGLRIRDEDN